MPLSYGPYTGSKAFVSRGAIIAFQTNPSIGFQPLAEIKEVNFTGAKFDLDDVTNYESGVFREWITTLADSGELSFSGNYIPSDSSQQSLLGFFNTGLLVAWEIQLPNSLGTISFNAYVQSLEHNLPLDKAATITGKLKITGEVSGF
jgi:Lambda phage tail tube protein, TTP